MFLEKMYALEFDPGQGRILRFPSMNYKHLNPLDLIQRVNILT